METPTSQTMAHFGLRETQLVHYGGGKGTTSLLPATCMFEELWHGGIKNYSACFERKLKNVCPGLGLTFHLLCCLSSWRRQQQLNLTAKSLVKNTYLFSFLMLIKVPWYV